MYRNRRTRDHPPAIVSPTDNVFGAKWLSLAAYSPPTITADDTGTSSLLRKAQGITIREVKWLPLREIAHFAKTLRKALPTRPVPKINFTSTRAPH